MAGGGIQSSERPSKGFYPHCLFPWQLPGQRIWSSGWLIIIIGIGIVGIDDNGMLDANDDERGSQH